MKIGCPSEIKNNEFRVGLTPAAARAYIENGHQVVVQKGAGLGSGIADEEYQNVGAKLEESAQTIWDQAEMIVKVKEPLPDEYDLMRPEQIIYTYFHLAAEEKLTKACLDKKIIAVAYETVQEDSGALPLLKPMSEVAGRMAPLMAAFYMGKPFGGRGLLPTGVPGVLPANVVILGGGVVGSNAAKTASGFGCNVTILDINVNTLEHLENILPVNVFTQYSNSQNLEDALARADIVVGAVLVPGAKAPKLITRDHLKIMKTGSVLVDVAIDQGGCTEMSKPTTHDQPTYVVDGVLHYCVANMPGAYARTSTFALNNMTIPYGLQLANKGVEQACKDNHVLCRGLNAYKGTLTCAPVGEAFGMQDVCRLPEDVL
ncbi:alanine dehydrogenase [Desulfovermiculus halophilus]|jgi:alanine dehydrogenase|uniref:alanine dehydrogenase n=1 Tax=Desulfovermiculus halophilus TaxID=339722 RepID=UPI0004853B42|nr:alanine dehydrogenase [Desulfovermiculus halophilus]